MATQEPTPRPRRGRLPLQQNDGRGSDTERIIRILEEVYMNLWDQIDQVESDLLDAIYSQCGGGGGQQVSGPGTVIVAAGAPGTQPQIVAFNQSQGGTAEVASVQIQDSQQVPLAVAETDAVGNAVSTPSPDAWSSSDTSIVTVGPDPSDASGLGGLAVAAGPLGTATVTVDVSVAQPDGTTADFTASIDVEVVSGPAAAVSITPGAPAPKA